MKHSTGIVLLSLILLAPTSQCFISPSVRPAVGQGISFLTTLDPPPSPECRAFVLSPTPNQRPRLDNISLSMSAWERKQFLASIISLVVASPSGHPSPSSSYQERAEKFGIATPEQVKRMASKKNVVYLDVRNDDEIAQVVLHTRNPIFYSQCTPDSCPSLNKIQAKKTFPNKNTPIIVFCASGKRARRGKETLNSLGYTQVVNAGAIDDIAYLNDY